MRNTRNLNALLVSLLGAITLVTSCRANTTANSEGNRPLIANEVSAIVPTNNMTAPRSGHTATLLLNGQVLIAGGMERNGVFYRSAELYDPAIGNFSLTKGNMSTQRVGHSATLLPSGKVLIAGGWSKEGLLATAEIYDPNTALFTPTGSMSVARGDFTATLLTDGRVLVAGGFNSTGTIRANEIYDPTSNRWTANRPAGSCNSTRAGP